MTRQPDEEEDAHDDATAPVWICPICFLDNQQDPELRFAHGGCCAHAFCVPCLVRLLNSPSLTTTPYSRRPIVAIASTATLSTTLASTPHRGNDRVTIPAAANIPSIVVPTLGYCPLCRATLDLFDLQYANGTNTSTSTNINTSISTSTNNLQRFPNSGSDHAAAGAPVFPKDYHLECSPLAGSVYRLVQSSRCGYQFVFTAAPPTSSREDSNLDCFANRSEPFIQPTLLRPVHPLKDASSTTLEHLPIQDAHYHAPTRTFRGYVNDDRQVERIDLILGFSYDLEYIARGALIHRPHPIMLLSELRSRYPLDGMWSKVRPSHETPSAAVTISILGGRFINESTNDDQPDELCLNQNEGAVLWLSESLIAKVALLDWKARPEGPLVGEVLEWRRAARSTLSSAVYAPVVERWKRESVPTIMPPEHVVYLGGLSGDIFRRIRAPTSADADSSTHTPTYNPNAVWGNTFCQFMKVGLASYHFGSEQDGAYISYEHPATSQWPLLDNGMPVPSRAYFRNVHFPNPHTFRGEICWQEDYGVSWQNCVLWDYEMVFDSAFTCILSGRVLNALSHNPGELRDMSRYGESLVYCNAALYDHYQSQRLAQPQSNSTIPNEGNPHENNNSDSSSTAHININIDSKSVLLLNSSNYYNDFRRQSMLLCDRLRGEGASVRTVAAVHNLLMAAYRPGSTNPIDYNRLELLLQQEQ